MSSFDSGKHLTAGFAVLMAFCLAFGTNDSYAQAYPTKPIRLVVTVAPGGIFDFIGRLLGPKLSESLGQPVLVENRPGAGGMTAIASVATAPADGYTILLVDPSIVINPSLQLKTPYSLGDLSAVTIATTASLVLTVNGKVAAGNVADLVALSKTSKLSYGSAGIGTTPHMAAELFKARTNADILHVPFKGAGPAVAAAVGGQVDVVFGTVTAAQQFMRDGRLRGLAVTGAERARSSPELPTIAEAGYPGYEVSVWSAIFVPKAVPNDISVRLNAEIRKALQSPDVVAGLHKVDIEPLGSSMQEARNFIAQEYNKWGNLIKSAKITPE